jgi:hypothetical protein
MVSKKQRRDMEDEAEISEDISSMSEESLNRDLETKNNYVSEDNPSDIYQYKKMRLVPNSEAEFQGLVDKDVVLANVKDVKPDPAYLRFIAETIIAMDVFFIEKKVRVPYYNVSGKIEGYEDEIIRVPDPEFDVIRSFLKGSYKADLTLSRAMGRERESVLDRSSAINKSISKETNKSNKYGGG